MSTEGRDPGLERVTIRRLPTGVPGLDEILGGGLPEYSFSIIAGGPGTGKTTLAHQLVFANANPERPTLYFTILGEPAVKMLRYQQQYTFFDPAKLERSVRFINLSKLALERDLGAVLDGIVEQVESHDARIVVVDSFRTVTRRQEAGSETDFQSFVQRLALHLASWQATSILAGEYIQEEVHDNPVFTVADGVFWLYQSIEQNSIVRKIQIMKMRGQASVPGLHTFRITDEGLQTFPRTYGLTEERLHDKGARRLSSGIAKLDALMGGGILSGSSVLLSGPSGSGKSTMASQFIAEGLRQGEPGVVAIFEELPADYVRRADQLRLDFESARKQGALEILYLRPLDLSVDETLYEIVRAVRRIGAKRVVIDSLAGFELALAPEFRHEFRESLYRMIGALMRLGVTIVSTVETEERSTELSLSSFSVSFLADDIVRLRLATIEGRLRKMLLVVKMRGSGHSSEIWEYSIGDKGVELGEPVRGSQENISLSDPWASPPEAMRPEPRPSPDRPKKASAKRK